MCYKLTPTCSLTETKDNNDDNDDDVGDDVGEDEQPNSHFHA